MRPGGALAAAALVVALAAPSTARAADDDDDVGWFRIDGWYLKPGIEVGSAFVRDRGAGLVFGPAVSIVRLHERGGELLWYGLDADFLGDTNGDASLGARWSLGAQVGYDFVGVELDYLGERVSGSTYGGLAGRVKLSFGLGGVYARVGHMFDSPDAGSVELGLYLKIPIPLAEDKSED
ncbi:MAG TPA: hypothetical protein VL172_17150 [Kofleriaceae bacterium]|nr:hypothetical protein [Kofleriaceae bacterium]